MKRDRNQFNLLGHSDIFDNIGCSTQAIDGLEGATAQPYLLETFLNERNLEIILENTKSDTSASAITMIKFAKLFVSLLNANWLPKEKQKMIKKTLESVMDSATFEIRKFYVNVRHMALEDHRTELEELIHHHVYFTLHNALQDFQIVIPRTADWLLDFVGCYISYIGVGEDHLTSVPLALKKCVNESR